MTTTGPPLAANVSKAASDAFAQSRQLEAGMIGPLGSWPGKMGASTRSPWALSASIKGPIS
jgi:hypothetical protein